MRDRIKKHKKGINPVVAGIAGAVVGVGAAVATSAALRDKKTRKKVDDLVSEVKEKATDYFDRAKDEPEVKKAIKKAKQ